ncbi:MAG: antitoxin VbhA family protein [Zoogloeaceae bacterium]|jgi:hypothetical protein|nr:antitoxin VbhA family protein [Zoogloeaceae bacterium]
MKATIKNQEAADQALAIIMLEGFIPDEEFLEIWNKRTSGEITREEYRSIMIKRALEKDRLELLNQTKQNELAEA